jgi:Tripartite tricarboxylate transporter TctB family
VMSEAKAGYHAGLFFSCQLLYKAQSRRRGRAIARSIVIIRSPKDFWAGLIYILFGSAAILVGRDYPIGKAFRMGPAYFPTILGGLLFVIGAISVIRSFIIVGDSVGPFAMRGLVLVTGSIFLFGYFVRGLGVALALPILIIISGYASTKFRWGPTIIMAVGLTVFCVLVFLKGLGIPLPVLGPWLGG